MKTSARVLVVEDEFLIGLLVEQAVAENGDQIVARASNIQDAMHVVATADFDIALLDLNLAGQPTHAVATVCRARGKPFAFITGYGDSAVLANFKGAPVVTKPFTSEEVGDALERLKKPV